MAQPYFFIQQCCGGGQGTNSPCCVGTPGPVNGPVVQTTACPQESLQKACDSLPDPCVYSPLLRIIISVLNLRNINGSTSDEILDYHNNVLCPQVALTLNEVTRYITIGIRQGALVRRNYDTGAVCVFSYFADLPSTFELRRELNANPYYQLCLGAFTDRNC
jgi:hypothetical protein